MFLPSACFAVVNISDGEIKGRYPHVLLRILVPELKLKSGRRAHPQVNIEHLAVKAISG